MNTIELVAERLGCSTEEALDMIEKGHVVILPNKDAAVQYLKMKNINKDFIRLRNGRWMIGI